MRRHRPLRGRARSGWIGSLLAAGLILLPLTLLLVRYAALRHRMAEEERIAQAGMRLGPKNRQALGMLGMLRLQQGRLKPALDLLRRAAALEASAGTDTEDRLALAQADIEAAGRGLRGADLGEAARALAGAEACAPALPPGPRAATFFSAGELELRLGRRARAIQDLKTAVRLQRDDWVNEGGGLGHRTDGLASYYQQMLAGAEAGGR